MSKLLALAIGFSLFSTQTFAADPRDQLQSTKKGTATRLTFLRENLSAKDKASVAVVMVDGVPTEAQIKTIAASAAVQSQFNNNAATISEGDPDPREQLKGKKGIPSFIRRGGNVFVGYRANNFYCGPNVVWIGGPNYNRPYYPPPIYNFYPPVFLPYASPVCILPPPPIFYEEERELPRYRTRIYRDEVTYERRLPRIRGS